MKFKEILKNKWGWISSILAVATLLIIRYGIFNSFIGSSKSNPINTVYPFISKIYEILILPVHGIIWNANASLNQIVIAIWLSVIIIGFILGLILQKIWRKFK